MLNVLSTASASHLCRSRALERTANYAHEVAGSRIRGATTGANWRVDATRLVPKAHVARASVGLVPHIIVRLCVQLPGVHDEITKRTLAHHVRMRREVVRMHRATRRGAEHIPRGVRLRKGRIAAAKE